MRKLVAAASISTFVAISALPVLAEEVTGVVLDMNQRANTLKLNDDAETEYLLPEDFSADTIKVGDKVTIVFETDANGQKVATEVTPNKDQ